MSNLSLCKLLARDMEETIVWIVFLSCNGPREKEIWSIRMEHSL